MAAVPSKEFTVHLRPQDNVAVVTRPIAAGTELAHQGGTITVANRIGMGHKLALKPIKKGEAVLKFGQIIGFARKEIAAGDWVHVHNVAADAFERDYAFCQDCPPRSSRPRAALFQGLRPRAGTSRAIPLRHPQLHCHHQHVNCSAHTSKYITQRFHTTDLLKQFPNVDGVIAITHKAGCAMQFDGADHRQLDRTLAGFARHANIAAYILVGLGCETGQAMHLINGENLSSLVSVATATKREAAGQLTIQDCGGISQNRGRRRESDRRTAAARQRYPATKLPAKHLILGTNCGGSDGNSGVTANPALGVASDLLVAQGGISIIGETPEIYGAEHLLTRRAVSREVGEKLVERIKWWEWYTGIFGAEINNNPSPGNKEGGLTTIYEKSLGAIAKGGTTAMVDVVHYAEPVKAKGFVVMDTPGYDPGQHDRHRRRRRERLRLHHRPRQRVRLQAVAIDQDRHQFAAVPPHDRRHGHQRRRNPGRHAGGRRSANRSSRRSWRSPSGKKTKSEINGVGEEEFAPWSIGPTL